MRRRASVCGTSFARSNPKMRVLLAAAIHPAWQPALNSLASIVPSLFVSTMVKSIMEGTVLVLDMAAPFGHTMVQTALHFASSSGVPFQQPRAATRADIPDGPGRFRDWPCCHVAAGSLVARVLAWVGVWVTPLIAMIGVRLPDYSLVSTIAVWSDLDVRSWHKADMLNALTNVRFWGQSGHGPTAAYQTRFISTGLDRCRATPRTRLNRPV